MTAPPPDNEETGAYLPMTALRYLRFAAKNIVRKVYNGEEPSDADFSTLAGAVVIANSVEGVDE